VAGAAGASGAVGASYGAKTANHMFIVGKDGTLVLSKDILHDVHPRTMKFENIKGVTYRILSDHGHLFVLTDKVLYGLTGIAERFLNGTLNGNDDCRMLALPMTAIDRSYGARFSAP